MKGSRSLKPPASLEDRVKVASSSRFDALVFLRRRKKTIRSRPKKYGAGGCQVDSNTFTFERLVDYRVEHTARDERELVQVEWSGGVTSWHERNALECATSHDDLELIASWHREGCAGTFADYRSIKLKVTTYSDSSVGNCAIEAVRRAFSLLGKAEWVTEGVVKCFLAAGKADLSQGLTWPQLYGFIKVINNSLGRQAHPNLKKLKVNLRRRGEHGVEGIIKLITKPGVFLARFQKAHVGHVVVLEAKPTMDIYVHDDGVFKLEDSRQWINGSVLIGVHELTVS